MQRGETLPHYSAAQGTLPHYFAAHVGNGMRVELWLRDGYWLLALRVFHGKRGDVGKRNT